jgi:16S rRNA (guanine527-N7)-methyltransferase
MQGYSALTHTLYPHLSQPQLTQLDAYGHLLLEWNTALNLVSRKSAEHELPIHIAHSLAPTLIVQPIAGTHVVDVGTGGGLPGMVLAIVWPECRFTLVDSLQKKARAVQDIAAKLGLANVNVIAGRIEQLPKPEVRADFVVGRAVARITAFQHWVQAHFNAKSPNPLANGILYLTGEDQAQEALELGTDVVVHRLREHLPHPFFDTKVLVYLPNRTR